MPVPKVKISTSTIVSGDKKLKGESLSVQKLYKKYALLGHLIYTAKS